MTSISRKFLLGVGLIALSVTAAAAAPAVVRSDLNLRGGPGTQYAVVGSLPGGATVEVGGCSGSWCTVAYGGQQGYASRNYLDMGVAGGVVVPVPGPSYGYVDPDYYDDDYDGYGPSYYGGYGPGVTLGFGYWGGRGYDHRRYGGHRGGGPSHWGRGRGDNQVGALPPGRPGMGRPGGLGGGSWAGRPPRGPSVGAAPSSPPPVGSRIGVSAGRSAPPVGAGGGGRGGMSGGGGGGRAATTGAGPAPVGAR
jgi:hypothetical protein